jgi:hypothetical protein
MFLHHLNQTQKVCIDANWPAFYVLLNLRVKVLNDHMVNVSIFVYLCAIGRNIQSLLSPASDLNGTPKIWAAAKTIHGDDSRLDREVNRITMQRLRLYALILGVPFRSDAGDKRL